MGNISSRPEEGQPLYLKDQARCMKRRLLTLCVANTHTVSIASLTITNARRQVVLNITPNGFPAHRLSAKRDQGSDALVNYVQVRYII